MGPGGPSRRARDKLLARITRIFEGLLGENARKKVFAHCEELDGLRHGLTLGELVYHPDRDYLSRGHRDKL